MNLSVMVNEFSVNGRLVTLVPISIINITWDHVRRANSQVCKLSPNLLI